MKLLRVLETHVVGDIHFLKGKLVDAAHPLIVGREHFFEEVKADIVRVEEAVKAEVPAAEKQVEGDVKAVEGAAEAAVPVVEKQVEEAAKQVSGKAAL